METSNVIDADGHAMDDAAIYNQSSAEAKGKILRDHAYRFYPTAAEGKGMDKVARVLPAAVSVRAKWRMKRKYTR